MPLKRTQLKTRSGKQASEAAQLQAVYNQMRYYSPQVCAGCGSPYHLSHSHLVPRSYNKALVCEPDNIVYHCLDWAGRTGCHTLWESNARRAELPSYGGHLAAVKRLDPSYYALLILKTHDLTPV